jgi:hypothetical protein
MEALNEVHQAKLEAIQKTFEALEALKRLRIASKTAAQLETKSDMAKSRVQTLAHHLLESSSQALYKVEEATRLLMSNSSVEDVLQVTLRVDKLASMRYHPRLFGHTSVSLNANTWQCPEDLCLLISQVVRALVRLQVITGCFEHQTTMA